MNLHLLGDVAGWANGGLDFRYASFGPGVGRLQLVAPVRPQPQARHPRDESRSRGGYRPGFLTRWEVTPPDLPALFGFGFNARRPSTGSSRDERILRDGQKSQSGGHRGGLLPAGAGPLAGELVWGWSDGMSIARHREWARRRSRWGGRGGARGAAVAGWIPVHQGRREPRRG
jgi:hypothetical protein